MKTALLPAVVLSVVWCNEATKCYVSAGYIVTGTWRLRKEYPIFLPA
jgi:E3 ubiquitin-protein ligase DOA10